MKLSHRHQFSSLVHLSGPPQTCVVHFCLETNDEEKLQRSPIGYPASATFLVF